jgi:hypothetical protein
VIGHFVYHYRRHWCNIIIIMTIHATAEDKVIIQNTDFMMNCVKRTIHKSPLGHMKLLLGDFDKILVERDKIFSNREFRTRV